MTYLIFLWSSGLMMSYDMCVTGHIIPWWNCLWWCQCFSLLSLSYQTYVYMADVVKRSMHSTELNGQVIMNTRCKISPLLIEILCLSIHDSCYHTWLAPILVMAITILICILAKSHNHYSTQPLFNRNNII